MHLTGISIRSSSKLLLETASQVSVRAARCTVHRVRMETISILIVTRATGDMYYVVEFCVANISAELWLLLAGSLLLIVQQKLVYGPLRAAVLLVQH